MKTLPVARVVLSGGAVQEIEFVGGVGIEAYEAASWVREFNENLDPRPTAEIAIDAIEGDDDGDSYSGNIGWKVEK